SEFGQIATGREGFAGAAQHHRADLGVLVNRGENLKQRIAHRHVVGVELIGTIQCDPRDRAALLIEDRWRSVNRHQLECRSALSLLAIAGRPRPSTTRPPTIVMSTARFIRSAGVSKSGSRGSTIKSAEHPVSITPA